MSDFIPINWIFSQTTKNFIEKCLMSANNSYIIVFKKKCRNFFWFYLILERSYTLAPDKNCSQNNAFGNQTWLPTSVRSCVIGSRRTIVIEPALRVFYILGDKKNIIVDDLHVNCLSIYKALFVQCDTHIYMPCWTDTACRVLLIDKETLYRILISWNHHLYLREDKQTHT